MDSCTLLFQACLVAGKVCLYSITICSALARVLQHAYSSGTAAFVQEGEVCGVVRTSARFFSLQQTSILYTSPLLCKGWKKGITVAKKSQNAHRGQAKGREASGAERCWRKNVYCSSTAEWTRLFLARETSDMHSCKWDQILIQRIDIRPGFGLW